MSVRTFGLCIAALFGLFLVYGVYRLTHLWEYERIGPYAVRRNTLSGIVQIDPGAGGDGYQTSFINDQYVDPIQPAELKRVRLVDAHWDRVGLLAAKALVAPGKPISGRFAFQITILDTHLHKRLRDRALRVTANWPAGALTPFVLRTNFAPPVASAGEEAIISLQPTLYSGENTAGSAGTP